jgi:DNA-binding response OmpR family regulator
MHRKALVVEDDAVTREALVEILNGEGCVVDVAIDGQIAMGLLSCQQYDVVLLDLILPKISGTDIMEQLLCTNPHALSTIIVVTGLDVREIRKLFPDVCDTLGKPLIPTRLLRAIRQCFATEARRAISGCA